MLLHSALILALASLISAPLTDIPTPTTATAAAPIKITKSICEGIEDSNAILHFPKPAPAPSQFNALFVPNINHNGFIARTIDEMNENAAHLSAAGIGPWGSDPTNSNWTVTHVEGESCGKKVPITITGGIAPNHITSLCGGFAFWEVLHFDNGILKDYAKKRGPGIFYFAMVAKRGVKHEDVLKFFEKQNIPVILHYKYPLPIPGDFYADIDFVQIGPMISEVLTPPFATPVCSDVNIVEEGLRTVAGKLPDLANEMKSSLTHFFNNIFPSQ